MSRESRSVYVELTDVMGHCLCSFCRFDEGDCCSQICRHPLGYRLEDQWGYNYGIEPGCDCWGFRPWASVDLAADVTGIVLAKGFTRGFDYEKPSKKYPTGRVRGY